MTDLKDVYTKVEENIKHGKEKVMKRKLLKGEDDSFVVGDKVLCKNIRQEQRKGGKLEADLLGPFTITKIEGKSIDLKTQKGLILERINVAHLKRYVEPQARIPAKWIAPTTPEAVEPSPLTSTTETLSPQDSVTGLLSSSLEAKSKTLLNPSLLITPEECKSGC